MKREACLKPFHGPVGKIGLTGGIGSGKTSVAQLLQLVIGAGYINVDTICRDLLEPGNAGWKALKEFLGEDFFDSKQAIKRKKLRRELFNDTLLRTRINGILHPLAKIEVRKKMVQGGLAGHCLRLVVEVPLLFEAKWEDLFDYIVVVDCEEKIRIERLQHRDLSTAEEARQELKGQMELVEKIRRADFIIDNSGSLVDTFRQVGYLANLFDTTARS